MNILLVAGRPGDADKVRAQLAAQATGDAYEVDDGGGLETALVRLQQQRYDVVLLELALDRRILDTVEQVSAAAPHTPVLVLTGQFDGALAVHALQGGAPDTVDKVGADGPDGAPLARALRAAAAQHQAADKQTELLARLRAVTESACDAILSVDSANQVNFWNSGAQVMFGYNEAEALGMTLTQLLLKEKAPAAPALRPDPRPLELVGRRKDGGEFPFEMTTGAWKSRGERQMTVIIRDITKRRQHEQLEKDRNAVLEMIARNHALPEILGRLTRLIEPQPGAGSCAFVALQDGGCRHLTGLSGAQARGLDQLLLAAPPAFFEQAVLGGQPQVETGLAAAEWDDLRALFSPRPPGALWSVPVPDGAGRPFGCLLVFSAPAAPPGAEALALLENAANLATIAVEQSQLAERLSHQSNHDALTGLPNRVLLEDRLQQMLALAGRQGTEVAVLLIDLDRFKEINDRCGHRAGDLLLRQVAQRLQLGVQAHDILARMGSDEFVLAMTGHPDAFNAVRTGQLMLDQLALPFAVGGQELFITASIGVSIFPHDGRDPMTLKRNADTAMVHVKQRGRNGLQCFRPEMNAVAKARMEMEKRMQRALKEDGFELHYQPQLDMTGRTAGLEALIRMRDPDGGLVSPAEFIPVAEETKIIVEIGGWVFRQACRQAAAWWRTGLAPLPLAVNVSSTQFLHPDFEAGVSRALAESGLDHTLLELEITESLLLKSTGEVADKLNRLREQGVRVAIDDFGTGYSSLAYLQNLPIDRLKIDQSFIRKLNHQDSGGRAQHGGAIVRTIIELGHSLEMQVVAEGVETADQFAFLRAAGCDQVQGKLFSMPLPAAVLELGMAPNAGWAFESAAPRAN